MTLITGLFSVLTICALLLILGYIALTGARALNIGFLVNMPKPIGEPAAG